MSDTKGETQGNLRSGVSRRRFISSGAASATLPPAAAASLAAPTSAARAASRVKALVVVQQPGSLRTVDPGRASEVDAAAIMRVLYDALLSLKGADPAPAYATDWTVSPDGLTYVFNLHPDWKFNDGSPVTPEDYIFSCNRQRNNKADASWMLGNVASMVKSGPNQITIKLKSLDVDFLKLVPNPGLAVTKAATVRAHGGTDAPDAATKDTATTWLDQHSVGTGPFMIDHWDRGSEMLLRANPYYWGPKTFETVVFRFVQDPTTQRDLLLRGDAHIAVNLTPDLADQISKARPGEQDRNRHCAGARHCLSRLQRQSGWSDQPSEGLGSDQKRRGLCRPEGHLSGWRPAGRLDRATAASKCSAGRRGNEAGHRQSQSGAGGTWNAQRLQLQAYLWRRPDDPKRPGKPTWHRK